MPLKKDHSRIYKMISRSKILSYIIRQGKSSPTKVKKKNLWVCQLEASRPDGKMILKQQTA